jgi:hypothetical protein
VKVRESIVDPKSLIIGPADDSGRFIPRSPGLHMSQIYQDIEDTLVQRDPMAADQLDVYRSAGFIFEHLMEQAMARSMQSTDLVRPGEFTIDGITGSPDLIHLPTWSVWDTKFTWRSMGKLQNPEKFFWSWIVQLKGYCYMVGTQLASNIVFFANGDYRPPRPAIRRLDFEFTSRELDDNWDMLYNHAEKRGWL